MPLSLHPQKKHKNTPLTQFAHVLKHLPVVLPASYLTNQRDVICPYYTAFQFGGLAEIRRVMKCRRLTWMLRSLGARDVTVLGEIVDNLSDRYEISNFHQTARLHQLSLNLACLLLSCTAAFTYRVNSPAQPQRELFVTYLLKIDDLHLSLFLM